MKLALGLFCGLISFVVPQACEAGVVYMYSGTYGAYGVTLSFNTSLTPAQLGSLSASDITSSVSSFSETNAIPGTGSAALSVIVSTDSLGDITNFSITNTNGDIVTDTTDTGPATSGYVAPATDQAGFALAQTGLGVYACGGNPNCLFGSYPAFPGENPFDFYCNYSETTGGLSVDNDAGFCPSAATLSSTVPGTSASGSGTFTATGLDAAAPEPASWLLLGSGVVALLSHRRLGLRRS